MNTKKMSLANIQDKLSRAEMRKIIADSSDDYSGNYTCTMTVHGCACHEEGRVC